MKTVSQLLVAAGLIILMSCQQKSTPLSDAQRTQIADSTRQVVQRIVNYANKLDFTSALSFYSTDADARFVENGTILPLAALREQYEELAQNLDLLENKIDDWNIVVLSADAVSITLPVHFKIKAKGLPEYNGQYIWSGILQKRNEQWKLVQCHESWLNYAEAMDALTPPPVQVLK